MKYKIGLYMDSTGMEDLMELFELQMRKDGYLKDNAKME